MVNVGMFVVLVNQRAQGNALAKYLRPLEQRKMSY